MLTSVGGLALVPSVLRALAPLRRGMSLVRTLAAGGQGERGAPALDPRTWYGRPAYARDGKVVCFFESAQKFKARYAMIDDRGMAPLPGLAGFLPGYPAAGPANRRSPRGL
jgi:hypothetical protein